MSRWVLAFLCLLACSTGTDVRYEATYANVHPFAIVDAALAGAEEKGYAVVDVRKAEHELGFIARPHELDTTGAIQVAFIVHLFFARQRVDGSDVRELWKVSVVPKAFSKGVQVGNDRLPADAREQARGLADAIRGKAKHWEAPSL